MSNARRWRRPFLAGEDLVSYIEKDRQRVIPLFQEAGWLRQ